MSSVGRQGVDRSATARTGIRAETQAITLRSSRRGASSSSLSTSQPLCGSGANVARRTPQRRRASSVRTRSIALVSTGSSSIRSANGLDPGGRVRREGCWDLADTGLPFVPGSGREGHPPARFQGTGRTRTTRSSRRAQVVMTIRNSARWPRCGTSAVPSVRCISADSNHGRQGSPVIDSPRGLVPIRA